MTGGGGLKMVLLGTPRFCNLAGSSPSATFSKKKFSATFTTIVKWQQCNFSLSGGGGSNRRISELVVLHRLSYPLLYSQTFVSEHPTPGGGLETSYVHFRSLLR